MVEDCPLFLYHQTSSTLQTNRVTQKGLHGPLGGAPQRINKCNKVMFMNSLLLIYV